MTEHHGLDPDCAPPRGRGAALTGGLGVLLVATFLSFIDYAALLPVVPLWAAGGGASGVAVGATTGAMMAATVATQLAMPWLLRVLSLRAMFVIGAVLLGVPTPLYLLSDALGPVLAITVVRGIGFAFVVISGATLVAHLAPPGRLASSSSLYGVAAALPNLAALAGGVWAVETWGFDLVFWVASVTSLLGAIVALALPGGVRSSFSLDGGLDLGRIAVTILLFVLSSAAFGAVTTFLPLAGPSAGLSAVALLCASVALVVGRGGAGLLGDRLGAGRVLLVSVGIAAGGLALMAVSLTSRAPLLLVGAALLGLGFGAAQNDSFVDTVDRLGRERSGTASTIWNVAYDGGFGLGAVALGGVVGGLGYDRGLFGLAAVIAAVAVLAAMTRRRT